VRRVRATCRLLVGWGIIRMLQILECRLLVYGVGPYTLNCEPQIGRQFPGAYNNLCPEPSIDRQAACSHRLRHWHGSPSHRSGCHVRYRSAVNGNMHPFAGLTRMRGLIHSSEFASISFRPALHFAPLQTPNLKPQALNLIAPLQTPNLKTTSPKL